VDFIDLLDADTYQDAFEPELAVCYECQETTSLLELDEEPE